MCRRVALVIAALCCLVTAVQSGLTTAATPSFPPGILDRVLNSLHAGLVYMASQHQRVNLDGVIGTRIVDGQLSVLLSRLKQQSCVSMETALRISDVQSLADSVSQLAAPYIQQDQPGYFRKIGTLLRRGFWTLDYQSRDVNKALLWPSQYDGEAMQESRSDDCLAELFGTGKKTTRPCRISNECWKMMTSQGYRHYSLTHQVFYLQIGVSFGCLRDDMLNTVDTLSAHMCAGIENEAEEIASRGFPSDRQDLFMEQQALCGMLGYRSLFRPQWLDRILSWQKTNTGCWGDDVSAGPMTRVRREERVLTDGCKSHRTAVALAALSQYVRYVAEKTCAT